AELGRLPEALAHCRQAAAQEVAFGRLCSSLVLLFLGQKSEAIQASRTIRPDELPPWHEGWLQEYRKYLGGQLEAGALLQAAGGCRPKRSEAHFAIGLRHLCEGDRARAREHFQKCVDARVFIDWEYPWVRAFLERLKKDRTWPRWIGSKS